MANSLQAKKRARQNDKRRIHGNSLRSKTRTVRKKLNAALEAKDLATATTLFAQNVKDLDKAANSGRLHKNTASRYKSRAAAALKKLSLQDAS